MGHKMVQRYAHLSEAHTSDWLAVKSRDIHPGQKNFA
jgi:hypothetical protein